MKKDITLAKTLTVLLILGLSIVIFMYNDTLRVPSIFDGKLYTSARIDKAEAPYSLPEKEIALPPLSDWIDSASAALYQYPDLLLQNTSTTSFLVIRNDTVIFKRYLNGIKEGENTQLFSVTKVFIYCRCGSSRNRFFQRFEGQTIP
jgi:hypothetical protein